MHNFRELKIWQEAIEITKQSYKVTKSFLQYEIFGLTSQMNRTVVSIQSNIAEGTGRNRNIEFNQF
jgi:four helix bundle protein